MQKLALDLGNAAKKREARNQESEYHAVDKPLEHRARQNRRNAQMLEPRDQPRAHQRTDAQRHDARDGVPRHDGGEVALGRNRLEVVKELPPLPGAEDLLGGCREKGARASSGARY